MQCNDVQYRLLDFKSSASINANGLTRDELGPNPPRFQSDPAGDFSSPPPSAARTSLQLFLPEGSQSRK